MYIIYALARFYPVWALPTALLIGEFGLHLRRRKSKLQNYCWFWVGFLSVTSLLWLVFRGDLNSDKWIRFLSGGR